MKPGTGNREPGTGKAACPCDPGSRLPTTRLEFTADAEAVGERLDRFLTAQVPDFSRSQIQRLIEGGHVTHSRYKKVKPNSDIREGDVIGVELPEAQPSSALPEDLPLDILFNDPDLVVVNKPAGMVVHPAAGNPTGTLVNALLHHVKDLSGIGGEVAARHRASARQGHVGRDGDRQERRRAQGAGAAVSRSRSREGIRRAGVGPGAAAQAHQRRDRPRSEEPREDVDACRPRAPAP